MLFPITYQVDVVTQGQLTDLVYKAQAEEEYIKNSTGILTSMAADMLGTLYFTWSLHSSTDKISQRSKNSPRRTAPNSAPLAERILVTLLQTGRKWNTL